MLCPPTQRVAPLMVPTRAKVAGRYAVYRGDAVHRDAGAHRVSLSGSNIIGVFRIAPGNTGATGL